MGGIAGQESGPIVLRILLGARLRGLREAKGITRESAGYAIRASESKISRVELGRVGFKERDVGDLLTLYGVTDEVTRGELLSLARKANTPGWWQKYGDILPNWFETYVGLEAAASLIRSYEVQFVPGLLQTEDYARAVTLLGHRGTSTNEIERRVALRMARQQLLTRQGSPKLWAVVDEAALRRPIGGPQVMRGQLEGLIEAARLQKITLQIMPFGYGGHSAAGGSFSILRFPELEVADVIYIEQLTGAIYLEKCDELLHYMTAMDHLCAESPPPRDTESFLRRILQDT
ncbi:MAG: helix-turn-helix domain-containing protein [Carbonactinosporaceae bacterium]